MDVAKSQAERGGREHTHHDRMRYHYHIPNRIAVEDTLECGRRSGGNRLYGFSHRYMYFVRRIVPGLQYIRIVVSNLACQQTLPHTEADLRQPLIHGQW